MDKALQVNGVYSIDFVYQSSLTVLPTTSAMITNFAPVSGDCFSGELVIFPSLEMIQHHMQAYYKIAFATTDLGYTPPADEDRD